jgi:hypothetical protein
MGRPRSTSSVITSNPKRKGPHARRQRWLIWAIVLLVGSAIGYNLLHLEQQQAGIVTPQTPPAEHPNAGKILWQGVPTTLNVAQVEAVSRENYGAAAPAAQYGVTRTLVRYRSYDLDNKPITVHARVYQPVGKSKAPIFGFASGTTGIGDQCAPSVEQPRKSNWANYESHLMTYAGQGYASVITDYEGMRDEARIHHYMVGELEGRAVIDSLRALTNLARQERNTLDANAIFVGGYSQGGHSVFWADQIAPTYAPELKIKGVVGFGPVMDVQQTWSDILHAANIHWFGPYVLTSYSDYYGDTYNINDILMPQFAQNMRGDVLAHCIDTNLSYWRGGSGVVYTPQFLESLRNGLTEPKYAQLRGRLDINRVGSAKTSSAKLINEGGHDNVVLPRQQTAAMERICSNSKGPAQLKVYPAATHYNTMVMSFHDTITWMQSVAGGHTVPTTCS